MVQIAGDFNDWIPEDLNLNHNGKGSIWQKTILLSNGDYQYKYLVDGNWIPDPENMGMVDDPFGNKNSVISV